MELKKAIEILKQKKDQYQREITFVPEQNGKEYLEEMDWFDTLLKVLDMPEEDVVFYGTRSCGKTARRTYEMGLIVGTKREREYWESKIKEKIEDLNKKEKEELKGVKGSDRYHIKLEYMYKKNVLQELLKGE